MKINPMSRNLIGKLFYFNKPIFRISRIIKNLQNFSTLLEKSNELIFSEPVIEERNPGKVLGKTSESIRFGYVGYKNGSDFIDKIIMGIGENGFYYDIHPKLANDYIEMKESKIEVNYSKEQILNGVKDFEGILKKLFKELPEEYIYHSNFTQEMEISNVVLMVEFTKPLDNLLNPDLNTLINKTIKKSETIIDGLKNEYSSIITFNIHPDAREHTVIDIEKVIVPDRMVTIRKDPIPTKNIYYIRFRGVPMENSFEFLESIAKIVEI